MAASAGVQLLKGVTATGPQLYWPGGMGMFTAVCAGWNGATVSLQVLGPDGSTLLDAGGNTIMTANGLGIFYLPPCQIQAVVRAAVPSSPVYAAASRINS